MNLALVAAMRAEGYDLNQGMVADCQGRRDFGAECMHLLALLSSRSGLLNRRTSVIMARETVARRLYPLLRPGPGLTLRALGKAPI